MYVCLSTFYCLFNKKMSLSRCLDQICLHTCNLLYMWENRCLYTIFVSHTSLQTFLHICSPLYLLMSCMCLRILYALPNPTLSMRTCCLFLPVNILAISTNCFWTHIKCTDMLLFLYLLHFLWSVICLYSSDVTNFRKQSFLSHLLLDASYIFSWRPGKGLYEKK